MVPQLHKRGEWDHISYLLGKVWVAEIKFVHMIGQSASSFHPSSPLATLDLYSQVHSIDLACILCFTPT